MPIYEYRCETCGQVNEFLVLRKEEQHRCKQCGGQDLTKLLSAHNTTEQLSREICRARSRRMLRDTRQLRHAGKLLLRVAEICVFRVAGSHLSILPISLMMCKR